MTSCARQWFRAPGRVNLVGDHTDYNGGLALPFAIELACTVGVTPLAAPEVRARSLVEPGTVAVPADGSTDPRSLEGWGRYIAGIVRVLGRIGRPPAGADLLVSSTVPSGSGLSSSAALEVSVALALLHTAGCSLGRDELAAACRDAEQEATGVPCGLLDQLASVHGQDGAALLIDFRSLAVRHVPVPSAIGVVVVHSGMPRTLATSAYGERRRDCEALAARLGLHWLADAAPEQVADEPLGRHVVSETARVVRASAALEAGDLQDLGATLSASHASLRDDYRVSTPELDALVEELVAAGAAGARLTGAGFGGCTVAVCAAADARRVAVSAAAAYARRTGLAPRAWVLRPVAGAGPAGGGRASERPPA